MPVLILISLSLIAFSYVYFLNKRLHGPHPLAIPAQPLTEEELDAVSYKDIDILKGIPSQPTQEGYAVIGGSGFLGTFIIRLLILRGETNVRIVDLNPPHPDSAISSVVSFVRTDITSLSSVRAALTLPFTSTGRPPTVIYHTAAIIRFWERASYCWSLSHNVNVLGTQNVLTVAKELPSATLVYTSTAEAASPRPRFARLGWGYQPSPWNKVTISDYDMPLTSAQLSESCYGRSKVIAERLVVDANRDGLKTGIIRPGHTIMGTNDRLVTSTLTMPRVPIFDSLYSHTDVCAWDVAAAHLLLEDALQRIPDEVGGEAFLITGSGGAWRMCDTRAAVKYYSKRNLVFDEVPPLLIYILAHIVEALLFLRYHALRLVFQKPSVVPQWMGEFVYMQPATLEYMSDIVIDDSRARKLLGYCPQWQTAQVIRWTVDEMESGQARRGHGLQLKSNY